MTMERCVYCLAELTEANQTSDHVFASSWYPSTMPPNTEKWQVPACRTCNHKLGKLEEHVRLQLALCIDPASPFAAGVVDAAMRSINSEAGKNEEDARMRALLKARVMRETIEVQAPTGPGVLPTFERNFEFGSRLGILISAEDLHGVVQKWVRGLHYYHLEELIGSDAQIDVFHVRDETAAEAFASIAQHGVLLDRGPAIKVIRWVAEDDEEARALYAFNIWQAYRVYAHVRYAHSPAAD